ncbi:MAG: hypothetical protein WDN69_09265 [Aliidongia sp.]
MKTLNGVVTETDYNPAQLLNLQAVEPTGFVGTLAKISEVSAVLEAGFGADTSLLATPGWDTATGWGEPNGLKFIQAAKKAAKTNGKGKTS